MTSEGGKGGATASPVPAARVQGLHKRFGHREVLKGIDLEIPAGLCFAIFGPNGAGKSTLLRVLSTRMLPTSGRLEILGLDAARRGHLIRSSLGCVFHDSFLRGDLTLEENLLFHGQLQGVDGRSLRSRIPDMAERWGLGPRLQDPVRTFSQGMVRRSTIIRSLLHDPRVWLLDEPFAGLDPAGSALLTQVIAEERAAGRSILMVTHDPEGGLTLCDDAAVIDRGVVAARGKRETEAWLRSMLGRGKEAGAA